MRVTLKDIADHLGLSKATVSRVLNGANNSYVKIPEETTARIFQAARDLGYTPNRVARALATGETKLIALLLPKLHEPYYAQVIYHSQESLRTLGYGLIPGLLCHQEDWHGLSVDGVLALNPPWFESIPSVEILQHVPLVTMGCVHKCASDLDHVGVDLFPAACDAIQHLIDQGCRRIAHVLSPLAYEVGEPRYDAFVATMQRNGLELEVITAPELTRACVRSTVCEHISSHGCPDALFCHNDDIAIASYRALRDLGYRVPDDVLVLGCDGIEDTEYLETPISTIVQNIPEMCSLACDFVKRRIDGHNTPPQQATLQARFEIRASTRKPGYW